jgi:hypothetical protein
LLAGIALSSATAAACRAGTSAADDGLTLELIRGEWVQNQKDYERMRKKRGGDTLPPPLSFAGYTDRRPIALFY